jgi:hypothetical protein
VNEETWLTLKALPGGRCEIRGVVNALDISTERDEYGYISGARVPHWGTSRTTTISFVAPDPYYIIDATKEQVNQ